MRIYTRTGDDGETGLFGGGRVRKDHSRVQAYGTVDETNALLGLARSMGLPQTVDTALEPIQADLFVVGAELACSDGKLGSLKLQLVEQSDIARLECLIDDHEAGLVPLKSFILPGGSQGAASLHLARTVCRRAERLCVRLAQEVTLRRQVLVYLNRLSDLLFVLARVTNAECGKSDVPWTPRHG